MYKVTSLPFYSDNEGLFETVDEAIDFIYDELNSDDFPYGILDEDENVYVCIVFQREEWRPS